MVKFLDKPNSHFWGIFHPYNMMYVYQLTCYRHQQFDGHEYVCSSVDLTGFLREEMFFHGNVDRTIEKIQVIKNGPAKADPF